MKCEFTYIKMQHSEGVEQHCQELVNKLSRFLDKPLQAHFTFSQEKFNHKSVFTLTGKNIFFKAECKNENFYAAIEECVEKMSRQLEKKKSKMKNHKQKHPAKELNNVLFLSDYREMFKRKYG